jgi:hypothetical protein
MAKIAFFHAGSGLERRNIKLEFVKIKSKKQIKEIKERAEAAHNNCEIIKILAALGDEREVSPPQAECFSGEKVAEFYVDECGDLNFCCEWVSDDDPSYKGYVFAEVKVGDYYAEIPKSPYKERL